MEAGDSGGTLDGSYNKLIHEEDFSGDERTLHANQQKQQGIVN